MGNKIIYKNIINSKNDIENYDIINIETNKLENKFKTDKLDIKNNFENNIKNKEIDIKKNFESNNIEKLENNIKNNNLDTENNNLDTENNNLDTKNNNLDTKNNIENEKNAKLEDKTNKIEKLKDKTNKIEEIAKWKESRWLVLSSSLFLIPTSYGYYKKIYSYSTLLLFTSLVSMNYWRKATYSWRRMADLILSKITFVVFVYKGIYVNYLPYMIIGYPTLIGLSYCFYLSGKLWKLKNKNWWKYHIAFHTLLSCELMMIMNQTLTKKM